MIADGIAIIFLGTLAAALLLAMVYIATPLGDLDPPPPEPMTDEEIAVLALLVTVTVL